MTKVSYERIGAAAVLTIDRPERRNAVDPETADLLLAGFRSFEGDDEARVLVLTGSGDEAFCAGADLKSLSEAAGDPEVARQWLAARPDGPLGFTRLTPSKPAVAAISGWALAGGLELALWCDLRIGTETARLGFPERRWGVPLIDGGTQRLPRIVGLGRGLDLILSGRIVDADEALGMGLLTEIVPPGSTSSEPSRWPRAWPPSHRTRCWPTAARPSRAWAFRSRTGSPSRRSTGPRRHPPASRAPAGSRRARAGAAKARGSSALPRSRQGRATRRRGD